MLEHIKEMVAAGQWTEIRSTLPAVLDSLSGDVHARACLALAKAFEETATTAGEYRQALSYARAAVASAEQGGLMHVWALHRVAAYLADFGHYRAAELAASEFLHLLPRHNQARVLLPWVLFARGRCAAGRRQFSLAVQQYDAALRGAPEYLAERIQLAKVWALAQAGQVRDALNACPSEVHPTNRHNLIAARAAILAAASDWAGARSMAMEALAGYSEAPIYDTVEAAELCLLLKKAAQALGMASEAVVWAYHTAATLCRWNAGLVVDLLPTLRPEGGVRYETADSHHGSAGCKRSGLRGAVG